MVKTRDHKIVLEIPFPNEKLASIAQRVMNVDSELKTDQVDRIISYKGNMLEVSFACYTDKMLRVAVNSFLEYLTMATRTMETFDDMDASSTCIKME